MTRPRAHVPAQPPARSDAVVFFGATGDLAHKKIFPALHAMVKRGHLDVPVIGVAKAGWQLPQLIERARDSIVEHGGGLDEAAFTKLAGLLRYVDGDYAEGDTFDRLSAELGAAKRPLHYLAIPPSLFGAVVAQLGRSACAREGRVIAEKPFGRDLASAKALNRALLSVFPEEAVFRIDHFLGKEPVQNLIYFRFSNGFFEPIWNRDHIASVQITMAEAFGVEGRGAFYEQNGAIRDVLENHLLQVVACLAMDAPESDDLESVRIQKSRLLASIAPLVPEHVALGQFRGYLDEPGVAPTSRVETYAAVRLDIRSKRWAGVPFYIRAGKHLPVTCTEVLVELKTPATSPFGEALPEPNYVRFRLGPDVAIALGVRTKTPGEAMVGEPVEMIVASHPAGDVMDAYERLLGDAMRGDATLFAREDAVEEQWRIVDPVLDGRVVPEPYEPGSWGPPSAARLVDRASGWHLPA